MGENDITEDNPLRESSEDRIERELRNNFNILFQIDKRLEDIANSVEANTANIEILEEAVATFADVPTRKLIIRFDHREGKIWVNDRFFIRFDGKEAELLGIMFFRSSGKPKKQKFYCSEVAEILTDHASGKSPSNRSIFQTAKRISDKLNTRLNTKNLMVVNTKEFYLSQNNR